MEPVIVWLENEGFKYRRSGQEFWIWIGKFEIVIKYYFNRQIHICKHLPKWISNVDHITFIGRGVHVAYLTFLTTVTIQGLIEGSQSQPVTNIYICILVAI